MRQLTLEFLPAKARGAIYGVATVLGVIDSAALAGYAKISAPQPIWLQFADGALGPVLAVAGVVAISHLTTKTDDTDAELPDDDDLEVGAVENYHQGGEPFPPITMTEGASIDAPASDEQAPVNP